MRSIRDDAPGKPLRLYINIDHVATLRQARRGDEPDPLAAAAVCEQAGADGITAHLREDRRHIVDADVEALATSRSTVFNLEMACTPEMVAIAQRLRPFQVTLVPERREEITTEGGLDLTAAPHVLWDAVRHLREAGIRVSLFISPDADTVRRSRDLGVDAIELHTGAYANTRPDPGDGTDAARAAGPLEALRSAAQLGRELAIAVHAGHGLTVSNVGPVAAISEIEELNIGHHVVSRAVFIGLDAAVREMRAAMDAARAG